MGNKNIKKILRDPVELRREAERLRQEIMSIALKLYYGLDEKEEKKVDK